MGSAGDLPAVSEASLRQEAYSLAEAIAQHDVVLLTGATTGLVYNVGKAAHERGVQHIGISPAASESEHESRFGLPTDACDVLVYTGFGLKGRNVVLVRSCDIVLFISGSMGSLNEFTIAHDEGKIIGCLTGTGGVADQASFLLETFSKDTGAVVVQNAVPNFLLEACLELFNQRNRLS